MEFLMWFLFFTSVFIIVDLAVLYFRIFNMKSDFLNNLSDIRCNQEDLRHRMDCVEFSINDVKQCQKNNYDNLRNEIENTRINLDDEIESVRTNLNDEINLRYEQYCSLRKMILDENEKIKNLDNTKNLVDFCRNFANNLEKEFDVEENMEQLIQENVEKEKENEMVSN